MVYAHKVNRVTISGTMYNAAEEWSTGFFLGSENADAVEPTQAAADAVLGAWTTFFSAATSYISNYYLTTQVKIAHLGTDGKLLDDLVVYAYPGTALAGGVSTNHMPTQCSLVASLRSDRPRGLASKGRMYLPGIAIGMQNNGKILSTARDTIATNLQTCFNTIRGHMDIQDTPILAAKGTGAFPNLTAQNDFIESIKVGDVIDTQRRRRNGLTEAYVTKVLT